MKCKIIWDILGASRLPPPIVYLISRPSIKRGGASLDVTFSDLGVTLNVRQWRVLDREVLGVLGDPDERLGRRFVILLLHQQQESIPVWCVLPAFLVRINDKRFWHVRECYLLHGGERARNSDRLVHRSDLIQGTDYIVNYFFLKI